MKPWIFVLLASCGIAHADFIGHDTVLTEDGGNFPLFGGLLTDAGLQYIASPPDYSPSPISADLTGSSLTLFLDLPPTSSSGGGLSFTLSDMTDSDQIITGASIDPATDIAGFNSADVSFNSENVFVSIAGLQIMGGQRAVLDFTFSGDPTPIVPEPHLDIPLLIGLAVMAVAYGKPWLTSVRSCGLKRPTA